MTVLPSATKCVKIYCKEKPGEPAQGVEKNKNRVSGTVKIMVSEFSFCEFKD